MMSARIIWTVCIVGVAIVELAILRWGTKRAHGIANVMLALIAIQLVAATYMAIVLQNVSVTFGPMVAFCFVFLLTLMIVPPCCLAVICETIREKWTPPTSSGVDFGPGNDRSTEEYEPKSDEHDT